MPSKKEEVVTPEEQPKDLSPSERYLLSALSDSPAESIKGIVKTLADQGAKPEKEEDLGSRKLAFPVADKTELNLVSVYFQASKEQLKLIERELAHVEGVHRTLVTTWKADLDAPLSRSRNFKERANKDV